LGNPTYSYAILSECNQGSYSNLIDWRQKGNYNDFFDLSEGEVLPLLEPVEIFIKKIKVLLNLV
jgi:uncharacterized protein (UPF0332 family)